jgi:DNA polymerase III sliding clamp (beta) subunit (PCNA family)
MNREELLAALDTVSPALSDNALIQILTHFMFDGDRVLAFNDRIALETPCKTDFRGAVPGKTLIALLRTSGAKDVVLEAKDDELHIKAGAGRFKLPLTIPETLVFEMPKPSKDVVKLPASFLDGLSNCMKSVSIDTSIPDQLGITMIPQKDQTLMFSTNNHTICHSIVKTPIKSRVILPAQFCEQVQRLCKGEKEVTICFNTDHVLLTVEKTKLFGRLVDSSHPLDYQDMLKHAMPDKIKLFKIHDGLKHMVDRAIIITESVTGKSNTRIMVSNNDMVLYSFSPDKGEVRDRYGIKEGHPDVSLHIDPKHLKAGLEKFENMAVTEDCIIMKDGAHIYLIAAAAKQA